VFAVPSPSYCHSCYLSYPYSKPQCPGQHCSSPSVSRCRGFFICSRYPFFTIPTSIWFYNSPFLTAVLPDSNTDPYTRPIIRETRSHLVPRQSQCLSVSDIDHFSRNNIAIFSLGQIPRGKRWKWWACNFISQFRLRLRFISFRFSYLASKRVWTYGAITKCRNYTV